MEKELTQDVLSNEVEQVEETNAEIKITQEEIDKLIKDRAVELTNNAVQERIRKLTEKHEKEKEEAVADALKKAKMTAEEVKVEEFDELQSKYEKLELLHNTMLNSAIVEKKLVEAGLPASESLVKSLVNSMDTVDDLISELKGNFDEAIQKQVDDKLKSSNLEVTKSTEALVASGRKNYRNTASKIGVK